MKESDINSKNNKDVGDDIPTSWPFVTSYFSDNLPAEGIYVEQYVPSSGDFPYVFWAGTNFYFGKRRGFVGIQNINGTEYNGVKFYHNNICSIWDLNTDTQEKMIKLEYGKEGLYSGRFGGEDGTGLQTLHPMQWETDTWYGFFIRRWYIEGENVTHMGMLCILIKQKNGSTT